MKHHHQALSSIIRTHYRAWVSPRSSTSQYSTSFLGRRGIGRSMHTAREDRNVLVESLDRLCHEHIHVDYKRGGHYSCHRLISDSASSDLGRPLAPFDFAAFFPSSQILVCPASFNRFKLFGSLETIIFTGTAWKRQ